MIPAALTAFFVYELATGGMHGWGWAVLAGVCFYFALSEASS